MTSRPHRSLLILVLAILSLCGLRATGHDHTRRAAQRARTVALAKAKALAEDTQAAAVEGICQLTIELVDADTQVSLPGLVRITNVASGKAISFPTCR